MQSNPLTRSETAALLEQLAGTLAKVKAGQLDATTATRHRIEGAVAALGVVTGNRTALLELLGDGGSIWT